jgi:hypothetical protein
MYVAEEQAKPVSNINLLVLIWLLPANWGKSLLYRHWKPLVQDTFQSCDELPTCFWQSAKASPQPCDLAPWRKNIMNSSKRDCKGKLQRPSCKQEYKGDYQTYGIIPSTSFGRYLNSSTSFFCLAKIRSVPVQHSTKVGGRSLLRNCLMLTCFYYDYVCPVASGSIRLI